MTHNNHASNTPRNRSLNRRQALQITASTTAGVLLATTTGVMTPFAQSTSPYKESPMKTRAFVYTEVQISVPFKDAPWQAINKAIKEQPGFINKTWFSGINNHSLGGIYAFDSIENAQKFVTGYFPEEAAGFGAAHNTRVFDATIVKDASENMNSPHFGAKLRQKPGAFVYTEVQINVPFDKAPWQERNPVLKQQPGLLSKTWLSGLHTNTLGGVDAFDTIENAQAFALEAFPKTAAKLNAAFYTRVFDANATETASQDMHSPFYL
ncbi:MAG: YdhR family protein [Sneathiella sp.]|nr:YdhR family protein [Sneathiella sp.]